MNKASENSLDLYIKRPVRQTVSVIGVPFEEGSGATGLGEAPAYLRELGIVEELKATGLDVVDSGDVIFPGRKGSDENSLKQAAISMAESAADKVSAEIKSGNRVIAIGGDHAVSLGTIAGASRACGKDLAVIWIDAHPDLSTWDESISKNIHGMQAAAILGSGDSDLVNAAGLGPKIKKQNILYVGLKDMDEHEIRYLLSQGIQAITTQDIESRGMSFVLSAIEKFLKKKKRVWVSLDMDGIEKQYVPSSPMATDDGLTAREVLSLARLIGQSNKVVGCDIVEFSRTGDIDNKTGLLAIDLASKLFGTDRSWYKRYMDAVVV